MIWGQGVVRPALALGHRPGRLKQPFGGRELADGVAKRTGIEPVRLMKQNGETRIVGQRLVDPEPNEDPK